ncbi:MAG: hypothetical protein BME93_00420 [Methanosarcinales archaeon Met12]|nr:MAG: hypothetical protein BME93_00420 [Methanosarcinales archaeon Met12]
MTEAMMEKIDHIEKLLMEINAKIDNFLGFEELSEEELEEIERLREEVKSGEYVRFEEMF